MAPVKTPIASSSSQPSGPSKHSHKRKHTSKSNQRNGEIDTPKTPGVQKIKASLRQTRRLLAKDNLAANVRVETERRLHALEKDLAQAQRVQKERTMATRYHKVKFFERQKLTRKITKTKRELESCTDKKEKKELKKALFNLRVDLNYILHYPKAKKYISLFPPEVRHGEAPVSVHQASEDAEEEIQDTSTTNVQREEIRRWVKEKMERGELSAQPELEKSASNETPYASQTVQGAESGTRSKNTGKTERKGREGGSKTSAINGDGFFGDDSDGEGGD